MDTLTWEEPLTHRMKVERNLNFSTISNEEEEFGFSRKKTARDPMSHRIIEKRRRDRMNNCLADLSRLVPTNYLKKGRGRIEKTEIIEMAIKHLKHLQAHPCLDPANCEVAKSTELDYKRQFRAGFHDCATETIRYLTDCEGFFSGDGLCHRLFENLNQHLNKVAGVSMYHHDSSMTNQDDKSSIQMEVDNHSNSCYSSEPCGFPTENGMNATHFESNRSEMKQEFELHALPPQTPTPPMKVTSQLREMLQNPGVPKDTSRASTAASKTLATPIPVLLVAPASNSNSSQDEAAQQKNEESVYKFKNNIKHRFNNDLRHTSSPTDSHHSDKMSSEEDLNNNQIQSFSLKPCLQGTCDSAKPPILDSQYRTTENPLSHNGLSSNGQTGHAFSPYPTNHPAADLVVKIPERAPECIPPSSPYHAHQWDSHTETASCSGSDSSPPPATTRSNASSSGYSSENKPGPTSPGLSSSYSRTPDRLSTRSPSPHHLGVPIFALHPKGSFYIPLTIDSSHLMPYLVGLEDVPPVLHPVSICVNLGSHSVKVEKLNGVNTTLYRPQSNFLMDKFHDRLVYPEKTLFYPCPTSPTRNGCT